MVTADEIFYVHRLIICLFILRFCGESVYNSATIMLSVKKAALLFLTICVGSRLKLDKEEERFTYPLCDVTEMLLAPSSFEETFGEIYFTMTKFYFEHFYVKDGVMN